MNIRNAKHVSGGLIDCEYEHPVHGWIPYTANQNDSEALGREIYALAAAGTVADADPEPAPAVPQSVTMRQARLALLAAGLLDSVQTAIAAAGAAAGIEWEYAQTVDRDYGLVPAMAAALELTDEQLDALFIAAAAL